MIKSTETKNNSETIINQEQLNNLFGLINRSIHLVNKLNNQLEEIFNSSEDLEEEIAFINTKLDILKGIELIASNQDITPPVWEYFRNIAARFYFSDEVKRIQNYIKEDTQNHKNLLEAEKQNIIKEIDRMILVIDDNCKEVEEGRCYIDDFKEEIEIIKSHKNILAKIKDILMTQDDDSFLERTFLKACKQKVEEAEDCEELHKIEDDLLLNS